MGSGRKNRTWSACHRSKRTILAISCTNLGRNVALSKTAFGPKEYGTARGAYPKALYWKEMLNFSFMLDAKEESAYNTITLEDT